MKCPYAYRKFTVVLFLQQPSNETPMLPRLQALVSSDRRARDCWCWPSHPWKSHMSGTDASQAFLHLLLPLCLRKGWWL